MSFHRFAGAAAVLTTCMSGSVVFAQPGPCATAAHRQFDFWLGSWEVFDRGGTTKSADVEVTSELDGCVVREQYQDANGMHGQSLSSYDAKFRTWQQTWVTNRGQLLVIHGQRSGDGIAFEGWIREGTTESLVRATWAPEGGEVRETAQKSVDDGKTWTPWFDLSFRRKNATSTPTAKAPSAPQP